MDKQPNRWADVLRELACILDTARRPLSKRVTRYSAFDAQNDAQQLLDGGNIEPFYTLGDQLFVEPQAVLDAFDLARQIRMSQAEVVIARSHIGVWRTIAQSAASWCSRTSLVRAWLWANRREEDVAGIRVVTALVVLAGVAAGIGRVDLITVDVGCVPTVADPICGDQELHQIEQKWARVFFGATHSNGIAGLKNAQGRIVGVVVEVTKRHKVSAMKSRL